jgi:hypothetical protein
VGAKPAAEKIGERPPEPWLHVACVKWGGLYPVEYVERLFAGVRAFMPADTPFRFVCYTDDARGLPEGVEARPLPEGAPGWWGKLALFASGEFLPGQRVVYLDLDVVVVGPLDWLAKYAGDFAACADWLRPGRLNSSVMAWRGGWGRHIWDSWVAAGRPTKLVPSDQEWIERVAPRWTRLQQLVPGRREAVSYRHDCAVGLPPRDASVVCFHGQPKPHMCSDEWVRMAWASTTPATARDVEVLCNTERAERERNEILARREVLATVEPRVRHNEHVAICGGGPSLRGSLGELRTRQDVGQEVWACNGAWRFLHGAGIPPAAVVVGDARPETAGLFFGAAGMDAYIAWHCHPETWRALRQCRRRGYSPREMGDIGSTVALSAACVAYLAGFRFIHLYGVDSSIAVAGAHHAYEQPMNDGDRYLEARVAGRTFLAAPWMLKQVQEFPALAADLAAHGATVTVHGDGLLPFYAREIWQQAAWRAA